MVTLADLHAVLDDVPVISRHKAELLYGFVADKEFSDCLELGVAHGKSAMYIAGALHERGRGTVTAVDRTYALKRSPNIEDLTEKLGLDAHVRLELEPRSYTWFLQRMLEQPEPPRYDFCFIDGGHTWDLDGFAFLLVDRLLRPGGWVLFDDLDWKLSDSPSLADEPWVRELPAHERETAQVRKVWELLVTASPRYGNESERGGWGFAQKLADDELGLRGAGRLGLVHMNRFRDRVERKVGALRSRLRT
jgi:predicted O-methyltransferase YrrM